MNCSDISGILDNSNVAGMDAAGRRMVEAHLSGCAECARDWALAARFADLPDMAEPIDFAAACRARVAASSMSTRNRSMRNRLVLIGAFVALAAAAMVAVSIRAPKQAPVMVQQTAAQPLFASGEPASPVVAAEEVVRADEAPRPAVSPPAPASPKFTVRLMPAENAATTAAGRAAIDALYAAVLLELRAIPGLTLIEAEASDVAQSTPADYWITIGGGRESGPEKVGAAIRSEQRGPDGKARRMNAIVTDVNFSCVVALAEGPNFCQDPAALAAKVVDRFRKASFPRSPAIQRELQTTLLNPGLGAGGRLQALSDLALRFDASASMDDALKDPATIRGAIALAGSGANAAQRAQIWRIMRGVRSADLVQPLIVAAQDDADAGVRQEAIVSLAEGFGGDARIREKLQSIANEDASSLNRALAQRSLSGEPYWRDYISSSLKDANRSDAERTEAFMYHAFLKGREIGSGSYANADVVRSVLDDDAIVALADLLPRVFAANPRDAGRNFQVLYQIASIVDHPAIDRMVLDNLESGRDSSAWLSISAGMARRRHGDPRLRAALEKYTATDTSPMLRRSAEAALQELSK
jgi:hypothetical protein